MADMVKKPVLVLGGGIGGIQASHDLAEMGIPVFLVEKTPSIGGRMAQLDKTFPTNDCSACILAPKVTDTFSHPLINTMTLSEVVKVEGKAPNFKVKVRKNARYIKPDKCKGCGDCTEVCPISVKSEFDMGVGDRKAVYKPFAQAVPNIVSITKKGTSPCKFRCPAHMDAHGYIALAGQGRWQEALDVVRRTTPFAGVLGRVCFHPCEENCSRRLVDDPLDIPGIKRFAADYVAQNGLDKPIEISAEPKDTKVAVIGAGPAGVNCAYSLAKQGYKVTVFDKNPVGGGMLKYGIPDYRLDKSVLQAEIDVVAMMGVEFKFGVEIGPDIALENLRAAGFKAIFLAIGAQKDTRTGIPGEDAEGVIASIDFLRRLNEGERPDIGKKVIVLGGGNVAMDACRSAVRLGCDVTVVYRRTENEMPASEEEYRMAVEEGVKFSFLTAQKEVIVKDGRAAGLLCLRNELGEPDDSGRRSPRSIEGSDFIIDADTIIVAVGQRVDTAIKDAGFDIFNERGRVVSENCATAIPDVFVGGDITGPSIAIEAVAAGNRGAKAIINYLEGRSDPLEPYMLPETQARDIDFNHANSTKRSSGNLCSLEERKTTFNEVDHGFDEETAKAEALRCVDCSVCSECRACEKACQSGAICHDDCDEYVDLDVSSIIMCPGYDMASQIPSELSYNRSADIVTALEYERILSASGPFAGHVQRPSDGRPPKRIAFIQCVSSRDCNCGADYCSSVCCMYAVKEAQITKEHLPSVEDIDIYYMDMRAYGKDFDRYVVSAKTKYGINFIHSRVGGIDVNEDKTLTLNSCAPDGSFHSDVYDMVVLSTGMIANADNIKFCKENGIKTDKYGFISCDEFDAPATSVDGIYACGAASGPKDIPETVTEASAAAACAAKTAALSMVEFGDYSDFFKREEAVPLRDVSKEPIRMGVFVCHCGINIGGYIDVPEVCDYIRTLPFVAHVEHNLYTCSVDAQQHIMEVIKEQNLNRVVVASCTPRTHEPLFREVLRKTGLNPYLFNMANIRDQCSWVHMDDKLSATDKAKELIRMAIGKGIYTEQLTKKTLPVEHSAMIIGGGMAGISAALAIADMGYKAYIIEKTERLGGKAIDLADTFTGRHISDRVMSAVARAEANENIEIYTNADVIAIEGFIGNFETVISTPNGDITLKHGAVIVATGANEGIPEGYLAGTDARVITQLQLDKMLKKNDRSLRDIKRVVMIQCVNSREEDRMYCSKVCCNQALRNAASLKRLDPDMDVSILYREMRSYGLNEDNFKDARRAGINFIRFEDDRKPLVAGGEELVVTVTSEDGATKVLPTDLLVLAESIVPDIEENKRLAQLLKVPMNQDGFFLEAHVKLRPVDFATEGVYLCGLAHSPKNLRESIVQGRSAAGKAATVISKSAMETEGTIAHIDQNLCTACGTCESVCAYGAVTVQEVKVRGGTAMKAVVNDVLCKGCGTCAANCRCGAIDVGGFSDRQIVSEIEYLLRK